MSSIDARSARTARWCDDLTAMLIDPAGSPEPMIKLVDAPCASERPESIFVWKRSEAEGSARFEHWIEAKLAPLPPQIAQPVEQFATWHHLKRIRAECATGSSGRGPVHAAKQEITKQEMRDRQAPDLARFNTPADNIQLDIDTWLASGPTT